MEKYKILIQTAHTHSHNKILGTYICVYNKNNNNIITDDVITKVDAHIGFNNVCARGRR